MWFPETEFLFFLRLWFPETDPAPDPVSQIWQSRAAKVPELEGKLAAAEVTPSSRHPSRL